MMAGNKKWGPSRWMVILAAAVAIAVGAVTQNPVLMSFGTSTIAGMQDGQ